MNPQMPEQNVPQPSPAAATQILQTRINEQRDVIGKLEDQLDYARAMWSTAGEQLQGLAAENSRLMSRNDQLSARLRDAGIDPDAPIAETADQPQDAPAES
jgi:hypothetical protein